LNRRGVALLAVLWLVTALTSVVGVSLAVARMATRTAANRILLTRAGWAREACAEILMARYTANSTMAALDTVDLGRGTWCQADATDPAAALNINLAPSDALLFVLRRPELVDALMDWRDPDDLARPQGAEAAWYRERGRRLPRNGPLASVAELGLVRGFGDSVVRRVGTLITVRGDGRINPAIAPVEVVAGLPGMYGVPAARQSATGGSARNLDEWLAQVPASARPALAAQYRALAARTSFAPGVLVVSVEGGIHGTRLSAAATL
jgi:general secretion pathway protein K